jgi:integrase
LGDIREYFDGKYVSDVKPIDCVRMLEHMAAQGYKSGTVSIRKSMLKQIFRFAVIHGDIDVSPAAEVTLPRHLPKNTRDSLTAEQIDAVLKFRGGDWWLMGIAFLLTGCRRGELMALRYEDIDRKNKTVRINKKYNYATGHAVLENHLKSEAGTRTVPLLPALEEVLPVGRIGLIFHNEKGDPLEEFQINKRGQSTELRLIFLERSHHIGLDTPMQRFAVMQELTSKRLPVCLVTLTKA